MNAAWTDERFVGVEAPFDGGYSALAQIEAREAQIDRGLSELRKIADLADLADEALRDRERLVATREFQILASGRYPDAHAPEWVVDEWETDPIVVKTETAAARFAAREIRIAADTDPAADVERCKRRAQMVREHVKGRADQMNALQTYARVSGQVVDNPGRFR